MLIRNQEKNASGLTLEAVGWAMQGFNLRNYGDKDNARKAKDMSRAMLMFSMDCLDADPAGEKSDSDQGYYFVPDEDADFVKGAITTYKQRKLVPLVNSLKIATSPDDPEQLARFERIQATKPSELIRAETLIADLERIIPKQAIVA